MVILQIRGDGNGVFYPNKDTKRLRDDSQFFNTAEMDSIFYERFYSQMTKSTFIGMVRATPEEFQFSVKLPETITHKKRLDINKGAMVDFEEFLDKISPLKTANKLGTILVELPPSFTVSDFKNIESFLDNCHHLPPPHYHQVIMIMLLNSDILHGGGRVYSIILWAKAARTLKNLPYKPLHLSRTFIGNSLPYTIL